VNPTGLCETGYYCPEGAILGTPSCESSYCSIGGSCIAGQKCPAGTSIPLECPPGYYCGDDSGLVTGLCAAGYYCVEVSITTPISLHYIMAVVNIISDCLYYIRDRRLTNQ
jgi:hypothetical protein